MSLPTSKYNVIKKKNISNIAAMKFSNAFIIFPSFFAFGYIFIIYYMILTRKCPKYIPVVDVVDIVIETQPPNPHRLHPKLRYSHIVQYIASTNK